MYPKISWMGGFLPTYSFIIIIGILASFGVLFFFAKKLQINYYRLHWLWTGCLILFGICSRLLGYLLFEFPDKSFEFSGETTVLGGIIGLVLFHFILGRFTESRPNLGPIVPSMLMLHVVGKIACLAGGCCYGIKTAMFWGISSSLTLSGYSGGYLHPTQIYEAILFLIPLSLLLFNLNISAKLIHNNTLFPFYGMYYALERFSIEYLRGDYKEFILLETGLSIAQIVSLVMFIMSISTLFWHRENAPKLIIKTLSN